MHSDANITTIDDKSYIFSTKVIENVSNNFLIPFPFLPEPYPAFTFAQVSLSPTVRLNTSRVEVLSGSGQK